MSPAIACSSSKRKEVRVDQICTSAHKVGSIDDLLIGILLRLPLFSLVLFKSVSKRWLSLITGSTFLRLRSKNLTPSGLFLWQQKPREFTYVPFDVKKSPLITRFSFDWTLFIRSCNGLLFSCTSPDYKFCVYNPSINLLNILPSPNDWDPTRGFSYLVIAFDPAVSPHYKVVYPRRNYDHPGAGSDPIHIEIYSSETGEWTVYAQTFNSRIFSRFNYGIYWRNAIHWINNSSDEVLHLRLDVINNPPFVQVKTPKTLNGGADCGDKLAVSCDCLIRLHRVLPQSSLQLIVYEMKYDYSQWSVKYHVNLNHITTGDFNFLPDKPYFTVHSIVLSEERQEEPFLVLQVSRKIIRYNIIPKTFQKLYDLPTSVNRGTDHLYSFLFNPSLARV